MKWSYEKNQAGIAATLIFITILVSCSSTSDLDAEDKQDAEHMIANVNMVQLSEFDSLVDVYISYTEMPTDTHYIFISFPPNSQSMVPTSYDIEFYSKGRLISKINEHLPGFFANGVYKILKTDIPVATAPKFHMGFIKNDPLDFDLSVRVVEVRGH